MEIPKITTFLMFNNQAEEAINLYTSLFENSEILTMVKYGEEGPGVPGTVQHSIFTLNGQVFMAIDADNGEDLPMNPSISLYITVDNAMEMERLFNGLKKEGAILMPKLQCHHSANSHGCKINLALVFNLRYLKIIGLEPNV